MPIVYDLKKDIRFKEGVKVGMEQSKLKKSRFFTIRFLKQGFLSAAEIAEGIDMPLDFVVKIQKALEHNPDLK